MISGMSLYNGMNGLIAIAALVSIFLVPKLLPEGKPKLIVASILLILSGVVFSVSLRIFRMAEVAYAGEGLHRVEEGTYAFVSSFTQVALAGNILDLLAIILLASLAKSIIGRRVGAGSEKEGA